MDLSVMSMYQSVVVFPLIHCVCPQLALSVCEYVLSRPEFIPSADKSLMSVFVSVKGTVKAHNLTQTRI